MINLIRADLQRVVKKPILYVFLGILFITAIFIGYSDEAIAQLNAEKTAFDYLVAIMASVPILIALYGDDFHSGSMITIIGRGMSRTKLMISKLITSSILLACYYVFAAAQFTLFHTVLINAYYSPKQNMLFVVLVILGWFRNVALFAFASIFMYAMWSVAAGLVTIMGLIAFLKLILNYIAQNLKVDLFPLTTDGMIEKGYTAISTNDFPFQLIIVVIYFIVFLIIGSFFFKKKEVDL